MLEHLLLLVSLFCVGLYSRADLVAENLLLRQQLTVLSRPTRRRPWFGSCDKLFWVLVRAVRRGAADGEAPLSSRGGRIEWPDRCRRSTSRLPGHAATRVRGGWPAQGSPRDPPSGAGHDGSPRPDRGAERRELEVLRLLAAGKPNREIADELYVTLDTVKKTGSRDRLPDERTPITKVIHDPTLVGHQCW